MSCEEFDFSESNGCTHAPVGCSFVYNMVVKDEAGDPEDITGDTFDLIIVDQKGGNQLLALTNTVTVNTTGFYINDAANGDLDIFITDADTIAVGEGVFEYQFTRTLANGTKRLEGYGKFQFLDRRVT